MEKRFERKFSQQSVLDPNVYKVQKKKFYMSRAYSDALGEHVLMEWSLKLVYA